MKASWAIHELNERTFVSAIPDLATLLVDAVEDGASVGFVMPFTHEDATAWWRELSGDVAAGHIVVVLLRADGGRPAGTAQLRLAQYPNQRHRADVAKVLVHSGMRRKGFGRALMSALEDVARRQGRTLLVLDTISGSDAAVMYQRLGWTRAGEIPRYAAMPDGALAPTTYYFKDIR
ncbi:MAG: GNAT family N-acetyltransferase [Chloroflexi bacterium]|nr:MAG: GNAT family N-acetyltransferase [Chloroflexota bacterium]